MATRGAFAEILAKEVECAVFCWTRLTGAGGKVADANVLAKRANKRLVAFEPRLGGAL